MSRSVGGIGEFIADSKTGYLIKGDAKLMADKLIEIATNKKSLEVSGIAANQLLKERFSVEKMAKSYFSLYSSLTVSK
jgi:glycosyltransferase involved in cell wall biosynthesis